MSQVRCPDCSRDVEPVPMIPGSTDGWAGTARFCPTQTSLVSTCGADLVARGAMAPPAKPAPRPRGELERDVMQDVRRYLERRAIAHWRNNVGMRDDGPRKIPMGLGPGSADLIVCYRGFFLAVELKSKSGTQSPMQRKFEGVVHRAGGVYVLARQVDDVARALLHLDACADRIQEDRSGAQIADAGVRHYQDLAEQQTARIAELEAEIAALQGEQGA